MLERNLIEAGICATVDAFDGSPQSIAVARESARADGSISRIRYFVADFNRPALPANRYDLIVFNQSLHHVAYLERLLRAALRALRRDGLVYIDEYVGPGVFDWNEASLAHHRAVFNALPNKVKLKDTLPYPIVPDDPSEAIRSSEIIEELGHGFEFLAQRGYGGNLLAVIVPSIRRDPAVIAELIAREREELSRGAEPYYMLAVLRPKSGLGRVLARCRYALEPKLRRVRFEFFRAIGRPRRF